MGLLKKIFYIIILISFILLFIGCSRSVIKIISQKDDSPVSQFGDTPERNFYSPLTLNDSFRLIWENDVHGSFNNSSFVFFDSTIFVHDLSGRIHTFDIYTGKQTGVLKYKGAVFSTPIISGYNIITALVSNNENKTELIFYDFFTGKELKIIEIEGKVINQMLKIDQDIVAITENGIIKRINSRGDEIWSRQLDSFVHCSPAYSDGNIYFGNDAGEFICVNYETSDIIYKKKIGVSFNGGVTIKNNIAYLGDEDGSLFAVNITSGSVKWNLETGARITMNPALDEKDVFIANLSGIIFSLNKNSGLLNWKENYNGAVFNSTPLITNDRIILSNIFKSVLIIDKANGELKKEIELDARAKLTPAIRKNKLFIGFDNGIIRAYEILN